MFPSQVTPAPIRTHLDVQPVRLRKGTHSCWQCKRRKAKCVFAPGATVCDGCRTRGSGCFTQDFPEDAAGSVEAMLRLQGRADATSDSSAASGAGPSTTHSHRSNASHSVASNSPHHSANDDGESLSCRLCRSLPSRNDTEKISKALPGRPAMAYVTIITPYTCQVPDDRDNQARHALDPPDRQMHPVLIARHMLLLACLLQHVPSRAYAQFSESPRAISDRLAEQAIRCVTTNDEMLGSIEGLACIMIESVYHAHLGNLRRSWVTSRRALSVAQLMCLGGSDDRAQYDVLDHRIPHNAPAMWNQLVFMDRFLCLLLGVPQGCTERSVSPEAILTSGVQMEQLERIHYAVAGGILERNKIEASDQGVSLTMNLDRELQVASRSITSKWWLIPKISSALEPHAIFSNTRRLFTQVLHYNLLNQLHLPYMLSSSAPDRKSDYSTITCVNASREILSRFVALRDLNGIATTCGLTDFMALMASITLVLAHLDSPFSGHNLLAHQYYSDRALIEQVQESFRDVDDHNSEPLSVQSANLLRRLIDIEAERGLNSQRPICRISLHRNGTETVAVNEEGIESVCIPYFGIIRIPHHGSSTLIPRGTTGVQNLPAHSQQAIAFPENTSLKSQTVHQPLFPMPTNRHSLASSQNMPLALSGPGSSDRSSSQLPEMSQTYVDSYTALGSTCGSNLTPPQRFDSANRFISLGDSFGLGNGPQDWAFQDNDMLFLE